MIPSIRIPFLTALAFSIWMLAGCSPFHGSELSRQESIGFGNCNIGRLPPDFSEALTGGGGQVSWVIREDSHSDAGRKVLVQESADDTSYRFPMCIYNKVVVRDVMAEVRFKTIAGKVDQAAGIVLRYSPENYYIARANALEDNIDLFKTVAGKRLKIQEVTAKVTPDEWHTLGFQAKGPHMMVTLDGNVVVQVDDTTFSEPGKVGLWTKADSVSEFADFKIGPAE